MILNRIVLNLYMHLNSTKTMKSSETIEMQHQICDKQWHCVSLCYQNELKQKIQVVKQYKTIIIMM